MTATSGIDGATQAAANAARAKAAPSSTDGFSDLLAQLYVRLGNVAANQSAMEAPFFQAMDHTAAAARTSFVSAATRSDNTNSPAPRRDDDNPGDPLALIGVSMSLPALLRTQPAPRDEHASDTTDTELHPAVSAAPVEPSKAGEAGAATRSATAQAANAANAAKDMAAPNVTPNATPAAGSAGGAATHAAAPPIQVTVSEPPVQAKAPPPVAPTTALGAQQQGAPAPLQPGNASTANAHAANNATSPPTGAAADGQNGAKDGGAHGDANNGNANGNAAAMAVSAAEDVAAAVSASSAAGFAGALDEVAATTPESTDVLAPVAAVAPTAQPAGTAAARPGAATNAPPQLPRLTATEQIAINIQKALTAGKDQITIQLKPAELGRIDVQLDVDTDGKVSASVRADRPETLAMLQRDAQGLERALQDAGLRADPGSLSFGLRGDSRPQGQAADQGAYQPRQPLLASTPDSDAPLLPAFAPTGDGRVDLHV